jgi:hypothetical protein
MRFCDCFHTILNVYFSHAKNVLHLSFDPRSIFFMKYRGIFLFVIFLSPSVSTFASSDSLVYSFNFSDTTKYDQTLTTDVDMKSEPGSIILSLGNTKNLARTASFSSLYLGSLPPSDAGPDKPDTAKMNANNLGDGNYFTYLEFPSGPSSNQGSLIKVDLRANRKISRIVLVNLFNAATSYRFRPRAFTFYAGLDSNSLSRIYQEQDNVDTVSTQYVVNIADIQPIRYLRMSLDRLDANQSTIISEMQIYGEGYVPEGSYVSKIDSIPGGAANFASVYLDADFDVGSRISFQMRTGSTKTIDTIHWSGWSDPIVFTTSQNASSGALLNVQEPRKYFQYKITLLTSDVGTPKVKGIKFVYQNSLIADSAFAVISPQEVQVLKTVSLTYSISTNFTAASIGIDTIKIFTPSPSIVEKIMVDSSTAQYSSITFPEEIVIGFPNTITTASTIDITLKTRLIQNGLFRSEIINKTSPWNPQNVEPRKTTFGDGWSVYTVGVTPTPLVDVKISPNPFTPNGDGKNDAAIIDFAVSKLEKAKPLRIFVFDFSGRKIRTIADIATGVNPFFGDPRTGGKGFLWDGKDDNGKLVLPGVYLVQVSLDVDNGGQFITKSVVVAY